MISTNLEVIWEMSARMTPTNHFLERISNAYVAARTSTPFHHYSKHWNIFPDNYCEIIRTRENWECYRRNGLTAGFDFLPRTNWQLAKTLRPQPIDERWRKPTLDHYRQLTQHVDHDFIATYSESSAGSPVAFEADGILVDSVDLNLVYNIYRIIATASHISLAPRFVCDIGGGYGGLASKLKMAFPDATVICLDLPEVNAVQAVHLNSLYPDADVLLFGEESAVSSEIMAKYDFCILPGWALDEMDHQFMDIYINTRSMMEMNSETIKGYFQTIQRTLRRGGFFYNANRYRKTTVGEEILIKSYPYDKRWVFLASSPLYIQPHVHELIGVRMSFDVWPAPSVSLESLPPYGVKDIAVALRRAAQVAVLLVVGNNASTNPGVPGLLRNGYKRLLRGISGWLRSKPRLHRAVSRLRGR
jgi:putative sugar O-methyltransferase